MHGKYPLPLEGALPEYPSRSQKEVVRFPRHLEGWRAGNKKRARPCWLGARGSTQNCLIEQLVRALPPPWGQPRGAAGRGAGSLRTSCAPQTSVSATLLRQTEWRCPGLGPANFCTITAPSKLRRNDRGLERGRLAQPARPVRREPATLVKCTVILGPWIPPPSHPAGWEVQPRPYKSRRFEARAQPAPRMTS